MLSVTFLMMGGTLLSPVAFFINILENKTYNKSSRIKVFHSGVENFLKNQKIF